MRYHRLGDVGAVLSPHASALLDFFQKIAVFALCPEFGNQSFKCDPRPVGLVRMRDELAQMEVVLLNLKLKAMKFATSL